MDDEKGDPYGPLDEEQEMGLDDEAERLEAYLRQRGSNYAGPRGVLYQRAADFVASERLRRPPPPDTERFSC